MPRGVKGSGPKKTPGNDVVAMEDIVEEETHSDRTEAVEQTAGSADFLSEPVNQQEFNEFVAQLARNAAQQEVAALDERIRDLEGLVQVLIGKTGAENYDPSAKAYEPVEIGSGLHYGGNVEEFSPTHKGGDGTEWYTG
jgi:hypothetical protein